MEDIKIVIATGQNRKELFWKNQNTTWHSLVERLKNTTKTTESQGTYKTMSSKQQADIKDVGGFVGGKILNGRRKAENIEKRYVITLDADFASMDFCENIELFFGFAYCIYSTHKHTKDKPRLRLLAPLSRGVSPDEYEAIARMIAKDIGIDMFDDTTYQAHRLMYWPSTSYDGDYIFKEGNGSPIDPDKILSRYDDWKDITSWPISNRTNILIKREIKKQEDPLIKKGIIGAFCKAYNIDTAIESFLKEIYEPCTVADRYTYVNGSSAAGLIVYDNSKFAYSNHATDPASGILCNAFDLVRIHKFGELDANAVLGTPTAKLPSYTAMLGFAQGDDNVKLEIFREKKEEVEKDFNIYEDEVEDDTWLTQLELDAKGDTIASISNVKTILLNDKGLKGKIALNELSQRVVKLKLMPWQSDNKKDIWTDTDDSGLRNYLEAKYGITSIQKIEDGFILTADKNKFHPIRDYLEKLEWDGEERLEQIFIDYLGAENNEYVKTVTRKTLVGAVARIFEPGIKFDYALIFVGPQGVGKSEIISRLGCGFSSDTLTTIKGKEAFEEIQGFWLIELGELTALKKAEVEAIKLFIAKKEDAFRQAYAHHPGRYPRQCIFIGTTNDFEFLKDKTGNRRFWPIDTNKLKATKNIWKDLNQDEIDNIWAEAVVLYRNAEELYLDERIEKLAEQEQERHLEENPITGLIYDYLNMLLPEDWAKRDLYQRRDYIHSADFGKEKTGTVKRDRVCALEIWAELMQEDPKDITDRQAREIKEILRRIEGWEACKSTMRFGGLYGTQRGFIKK